MYNKKSDHFSPKIKPYSYGTRKSNAKKSNRDQQRAYIWRWKHMVDFNFYQNYRQRYTVIPITIVRGPLYNHLRDNNLLYKYQSGFLPHFSTVFQLIDIYNDICQSFDNHQFSCMVFCGIPKAFGRVWNTTSLDVKNILPNAWFYLIPCEIFSEEVQK